MFGALCGPGAGAEVMAPHRKRALAGFPRLRLFSRFAGEGGPLCTSGPSLCQHPVSVEVQEQGEERGLSPDDGGTVRTGMSQMNVKLKSRWELKQLTRHG